MGAPLCNQFWKIRSKHGRDKLFSTPEKMWEAACEYFNWVDAHPWFKPEAIKSGDMAGTIMKVPTARPYTLQGLCRYLRCNTLYFRDFEKAILDKKDETSKDFSLIIHDIYEVIYQNKFEGASTGAFNAVIMSRDLGLTDKKDITSNGNTINTTVIIEDPNKSGKTE